MKGRLRRPRRAGLVLLFIAVAATLGAVAHFWPALSDRLDVLVSRNQRALIQRVENDLRNGDPQSALEHADKLVAINPLAGHFLKGHIFMQLGRHGEAVDEYDAVLTLDTDNSLDVHFYKAVALAELGQDNEAIAEYSEAIRLDGGHHLALNNRAYTRALARIELDDARADVQQALEMVPDNPAYIDTLAYLYYLGGEHTKALEQYERVLNHVDRYAGPDEELGEIHFHRGLVYQQMGKPDLAARDFELAGRLGFEIHDFPPPVARAGNREDAAAEKQ